MSKTLNNHISVGVNNHESKIVNMILRLRRNNSLVDEQIPRITHALTHG